ncbi:pyridine nucleotide-disulfide oxidoreductase, class II [Paenibacillus riograndensis SBR5]|uniref:Pyridine nucleotide-disulfide oxidoreductase, class II n=1 Tax=Paenibacillus riograndensis SBR5 TaxID=1073571 RepID=A0A0E3WHH1_9BACL|nr:pyridine nucleotide-disulfide oxidoreductase, class II [Paenibacillus riograndensis SBR5]
MKDQPLDIPGLAEVYGKSAFVCPYCDGWELRDQPLVIITKGAELMHFAPLISGWTDRFTVCTNGPDQLTDAEREEFKGKQVPLFQSPIRHIDSSDGLVRQVVLEDGTDVSCRGIFFKPERDWSTSVICFLIRSSWVEVSEHCRTTSACGSSCSVSAASEAALFIYITA